MCDAEPVESSPRRPVGAQEVRAAVIRAAGRRLASDGLRASLRDIAADAGVNVGLIHRHIGNKDDLVRAVLATHSEVGAKRISRAADLGTAFASMFEQLDSGAEYVRIVAWLLLAGPGTNRDWDYQREYDTVQALRAKMPSGADDVALMAAMALVYGWAVFKRQLVDAFGAEPAASAELDRRMGALAARLAGAPAPSPARSGRRDQGEPAPNEEGR